MVYGKLSLMVAVATAVVKLTQAGASSILAADALGAESTRLLESSEEAAALEAVALEAAIEKVEATLAAFRRRLNLSSKKPGVRRLNSSGTKTDGKKADKERRLNSSAKKLPKDACGMDDKKNIHKCEKDLLCCSPNKAALPRMPQEYSCATQKRPAHF